MEVKMTRAQINWWTGRLPVAMSLVALGIVALVVTTGWERHLHDEGAAAHLFQLLMVGEIPLIGLFLLTIERGGARRAARLAIAQGILIALALGSVAFFRL
jgi:hypothetical protein